jgi:hypothetical protein
MRTLPADIWRKVALPIALVVCTPRAALPVSMGYGSSIDDSLVSDHDQIQQLVHILSGAYENSLMHASSKAGLEAEDALLETASIQFSSRALAEIKGGSCGSSEQGTRANACALADPSLALGDWAAMLSHAAHRLENLTRSPSAAYDSDNSHAVITERIKTMEHLYRMVFAVSKIYLDQSQTHIYLDAAQEQLGLARQHMEAERNLCACDSSVFAERLRELSELSDQISTIK